MQRVQEELAQREVEGTAGGGAVKAVAKCDGSIVSVKIDPKAPHAAAISGSACQAALA